MLRYSTYQSIYDNDQASPHDCNMKDNHIGTILKSFPFVKLMFVLLIAAFCFKGAFSVFAGGLDEPTDTKLVIVQAGDSLWQIASLHKPADMDTRVYLDSIRRANAIKGPDIQAGEVLSLPVW
ncbi:hypothetical protein JCM10914A_41320 [Paenibacillus sp. JCM 10914]|nr:hypothetical protein JCM10914_1445 [Paenibacillus sp. JCM 10914]